MPELPDINAYLHALDVRIVGRTIDAVRVRSAFVVRTAQPPIAEVQGHVVRELKRIGKRVAIGLDNGLWIVIHLMVAGRLHWRAPGAALQGRYSLVAFDFAGGSLVLTEAGTKRRASIHVVSGNTAMLALNPGGIEVLSSSPEEFRRRSPPFGPAWPCTGASGKRARDAATRSCASAMPIMRRITARAARLEADCWPTARCRACWAPIGGGPWKNSRRSNSAEMPAAEGATAAAADHPDHVPTGADIFGARRIILYSRLCGSLCCTSSFRRISVRMN
jgi:hypothetical protein